jgi:DNA-binding NtrC family response regulator
MPQTPSILVVDDDERWRLVLQNLLSSGGYCVRTAEGEEQALTAIAEQFFDLLLLDYKLGPGNGLNIIRRAKEMTLNFGAVIVVTGFPDVSAMTTAMSLGAVDFFNKGDLNDLRSRLQEVLLQQSSNR